MLLAISFGLVIFTGLWLFNPGVGESEPSRGPIIRRPGIHAVPPEAYSELNAPDSRSVPKELKTKLLMHGQPAVMLFLKADCECSLGFARGFNKLAPTLNSRANCFVVIEGTKVEVSQFVEECGLLVPVLTENVELLAGKWGIKKAGGFVLVRPNGLVEVAWPGISRQSFRDLGERLGAPGLFQDSVLADFPGAVTAGCPLGPVS